LLSCYSLIKPPKGSNISGGEMLNSLIQMSSIGSKNDQLTREQIDDLLDEGHFDALLDHTYTEQDFSINNSIDMSALTYFIGYIARLAKQFSTAEHCENYYLSLIKTYVQN